MSVGDKTPSIGTETTLNCVIPTIFDEPVLNESITLTSIIVQSILRMCCQY